MPARQKLHARLALVLFAVLGGLWLARLDYAKKISTNVIDLIPDAKDSPELALVRSLADERQARVLLFALRTDATSSSATPPSAASTPPPTPGPAAPPTAAAHRFAAALKSSPAFAEVVDVSDTTARDALGRFIFERRHDLLLPAFLGDRSREFAATGKPAAEFSPWLAERVAADLDAFLAQPESIAFQELVPADPLLLVATVAREAQAIAAPGGGANSAGHVLLWARINASPLSEDGQQPVFDAIAAAFADARRLDPALALEWTGVNRFAAESRHRIQAELSWLNTLSLVAVLGVACVFVRRLWKVLHLVPVIVLSTLAGWVVTTMIFDHIHILVFVLGSLLAGVAIDYGFYLYMQPALFPEESYRSKLNRLLKPLLTSCLTTVIGFSLLFFSELPLIRHLGVFVSAGLIGALVTAILYFAQLDRPFMETRAFTLPLNPRLRTAVRLLFVAGAVVAAIGPWRLHWHDDVKQLQISSPELQENDARLRALFGDSADNSVYLTRGDTPAAARASLTEFLAWHRHEFPQSSAASLGLVLPPEADVLAQPSVLRRLDGFDADLGAALARHGYIAENFSAFSANWKKLSANPVAPAYASLVDDLRAHLPGPLGLLFNAGEKTSWLLTIADHPPGAEPPPDTHTAGTNQLQTLNNLFARYRASAARLSAIGLSLVGASVFVLYGLRRGVRIFMIPAGSCFFALGLFGLLGHTLNLFHLLGAFLGVCLSHNYAIFSAENAGRSEPPPPSIRLSALCTAASFGVLGLSGIPVIAALGTTVATIVLTALLMVELEPLRRPAP